MRIRSHLDVTVDLLGTTTEVAEVAKAAAKFGASIALRPDPERPGDMTARMRREDVDWLSRDLPRLVLLLAMAEDRTVDHVLEQTRRQLLDWHAPLDRPPSDMAGIGDADESHAPQDDS